MRHALRELYHEKPLEWLDAYCRTEPLARLREVGMNCGCEYTAFPLFSDLGPYSRYEHSLATARIVWHFTASRRQTIAALLHDIATPVFAHVVDFLQGDHEKQESTEAGTAERIASCRELCQLLEADGLTLADVSDYHIYPIADNDSPRLSADRLEYTMGNLLNYRLEPFPVLQALYRDLMVGENEEGEPELAFQTAESASRFARAALKTSQIYVAAEDRFAMESLANLLRHAISRGILKREDLWSTEPWVIAKLKRDPETAAAWQRYCGFYTVEQAEKRPESGIWLQIPAKRRWIDPLVPGLGRVSQWDSAFRAEAEIFRSLALTQWICGHSRIDGAVT